MHMYNPGERETQQVQRAFTYHSPIANQVPRYKEIRDKAGCLATDLLLLCPPSRELSLALTRLEEVVMYANAAIARNEPNHAMLERPNANPTTTEEVAQGGGSLPFDPAGQDSQETINRPGE